MTQYPRDGGYSELPEHSIALCFSLEVNGVAGLKIKGSAKSMSWKYMYGLITFTYNSKS